jgi:hypothetical protein
VLRPRRRRARAQQGFVNSSLLVQDYEDRAQRIKRMKAEVETLKERHAFLAQHKAGASRTRTGSARG